MVASLGIAATSTTLGALIHVQHNLPSKFANPHSMTDVHDNGSKGTRWKSESMRGISSIRKRRKEDCRNGGAEFERAISTSGIKKEAVSYLLTSRLSTREGLFVLRFAVLHGRQWS